MRIPFVCFLFLFVQAHKIDHNQNEALKKICGENRKVKGSRSRVSIFKIFNGKDAERGQWPWATALDLARSKEADCTGSLISQRHILTAAHCVVDMEVQPCGSKLHNPQAYRAHIGTEHFKSSFNPKHQVWFENSRGNADQQVYQVKEFHNHGEFNCSGMYDIAIVELEREVPKQMFDQGIVNVVCLPHKNEPVEMEMVAHGWGLTVGKFDTMNGANHLQWTELIFMPLDECKRRYAETDSEHMPGNDAICIVESNTNVCMGDSGGPLLKLNRKHSRFILLGVLSHGSSCVEMNDDKNDEKRDKRTGGVYTDVRKYLNWICGKTNVCYTSENTSKTSKSISKKESASEKVEPALKRKSKPVADKWKTASVKDATALKSMKRVINNEEPSVKTILKAEAGKRWKIKTNVTIQTEEILLP